jgi:hypothetical protein
MTSLCSTCMSGSSTSIMWNPSSIFHTLQCKLGCPPKAMSHALLPAGTPSIAFLALPHGSLYRDGPLHFVDYGLLEFPLLWRCFTAVEYVMSRHLSCRCCFCTSGTPFWNPVQRIGFQFLTESVFGPTYRRRRPLRVQPLCCGPPLAGAIQFFFPTSPTSCIHSVLQIVIRATDDNVRLPHSILHFYPNGNFCCTACLGHSTIVS